MAIAFNSIPLTINTPGSFIEIDTSRAVQGLGALPHTVLICGIMGSTGTATAGEVTKVNSGADAVGKFGQHSPVAEAVAAYKSVDALTEVFAIGLTEGTGAQAAGSFAWSGTATEDGAVYGYVGGRRFGVAVTSGDTATDVADAFLVSYNLLLDSPCSMGSTTGTNAVTARFDGAYGNDIQIGVNLQDGEELPAGITVTLTQPVSGSIEPDYADAITAMGEEWYNTIVMCTSDSTEIGKMVTELEDRWGPMRQLEGSLFVSKPDTATNLTTYGNGFDTQTLVVTGTEKSALSPLAWEVAAMEAARDAAQAQVDPARHTYGLVLPGASAAPRGARFSRAERDTLLSDGISTTKAGSDGRMYIERVITTWQTQGGIANDALKDQPHVRTLSAIRYTLRQRIASKYGRHKLADNGNEIAGQPIVTPDTIRAELISIFLQWQSQGWVENVEQYKAELLVERDETDPNRVNAIIPPDLINSFYVFASSVQFLR